MALAGRWVQGGAALGRTRPGARILVDGQPLTTASAAGWFIVGFDRDAAPRTVIEARAPGFSAVREIGVAAGQFDEQRIDGLPPSQVSPTDPALLARIRRESALKAEAFASRDDGDGFRDGFAWPVQGFRVSGRFGNRRVLNGEPKRPHYGIDLALPAGSAIRAPAPGLVVLAEPNLHFEGGLTLIDHGQGLISMYLHQSRLDVAKGQRVARGQRLGSVGATGRATGPHLCWRLKWRDRNLDPSLLVDAPLPALA